jgi:hypothetical protein
VGPGASGKLFRALFLPCPEAGRSGWECLLAHVVGSFIVRAWEIPWVVLLSCAPPREPPPPPPPAPALGLPELISFTSYSFSSPQKAGQEVREVSKMLGSVGSTGRHWGWPWAPSMHFSCAASAW